MTLAGIIFDFDGVLLESEFEGNRHLAQLLTELGHPTTTNEALTHYIGLSGKQFIDAIEQRIGTQLPPEFEIQRNREDARVLAEGLHAVSGAVDFVRALSPALPKAVASSSTRHWVQTHLAHLGLGEAFGDHVYSGRGDVERGKPAPDLYLHAARQIGIPVEQVTIIEDSEVGARAALASGARVIGLVAGAHCLEGHGERLRALGVEQIAYSFADVSRLFRLA
jgi:HAD superfamily hydrolase (TIGR01509 family)